MVFFRSPKASRPPYFCTPRRTRRSRGRRPSRPARRPRSPTDSARPERRRGVRRDLEVPAGEELAARQLDVDLAARFEAVPVKFIVTGCGTCRSPPAIPAIAPLPASTSQRPDAAHLDLDVSLSAPPTSVRPPPVSRITPPGAPPRPPAACYRGPDVVDAPRRPAAARTGRREQRSSGRTEPAGCGRRRERRDRPPPPRAARRARRSSGPRPARASRARRGWWKKAGAGGLARLPDARCRCRRWRHSLLTLVVVRFVTRVDRPATAGVYIGSSTTGNEDRAARAARTRCSRPR